MSSSMRYLKAMTVIGNVLVFGFTCLVTATEGAPNQSEYIVLTLMLMIVPILTVFAVVHSKAGTTPPTPPVDSSRLEVQRETSSFLTRRVWIERASGVCNIVLLGFVGLALLAHYPPPEGVVVVVFGGFIALVLILSATVLFRLARLQRLPESR